MGYSAGTLDLSVLGTSESAVASIDRTVKSLNSLSRAVNKINNAGFYSASVHLENLFNKLAKSTNAINTTNISHLASAAKSLSALSKIGNLQNVNWDTVSAGFGKLTTAITPFVEKAKEAEASLTALNGIVSKVSGKKIGDLLNGSNSSSTSNSKSFSLAGLFNLVKWAAIIRAARRLGGYVAKIVQSGSDYTETLNLWQVAMRNNLDMADEFVNKMNKAYGISSKTIMNAQATFKNMIGSLGQIDDATAYKLSEALVQMSADFSSLYNVKLESAFQKMQAMLAGQVRPIRSAGLDMTETTLYQYYQALGGTKSMRQLNRTEKQLLSILAVYKQMGSAGALGDMTKTLNQFANQSRMMTEYWAELKSWTGLILKDFLDQNEVLIYINAALITMTEIIKAIARSKGLGEENFIDGMFETTEATNEEIDKLQGKLLDFDKFRSLDQGQDNALGIDTKLLEALAGYSSKIDEATNAAQDLANTWLKALGFIDDVGLFDTKKLKEVEDAFKDIGAIIGITFGVATITAITNFIGSLKDAKIIADLLKLSMDLLNVAILSGAFYAIYKAIDAFSDGNYWAGVLESAIAVSLVGAFILLKNAVLIDGILYLDLFGKTINGTFLVIIASIALLTAGIMSIVGAWDDMSGWHKALTIIGAVTAAIIGAVVAIKALSLSVPVALALGAALAGGVLLISSQFKTQMGDIPKHAMGASNIDGGTLFIAGEMGKTEAVYTGSNGKTNVANVKQMEQAFYNALQRHSAEGNEPIIVQAYLDGEKVYENTTARAKARGKVWAKA